jgi:hypothetical protein
MTNLSRDVTHYNFLKQFKHQNKFTCEPASISFALYGKNSAFSRLHCDPEGFSSAIKLVSGCKIWAVMISGTEAEDGPVACLDNWRNWYKCKWDVTVLSKEDTM